MFELKQQLASKLLGILNEENPDNGLDTDAVLAMFEYPPDPAMGDIAFPCFKLSRILRKAPPLIAQSLKEKFSDKGFSKVDSVGGYLNFYVSDEFYTKTLLGKVLTEKENFGSSKEGCGKTVVLDYSSPNVAKPFHIGHLGTTVIGHSLKLLHEFAGYKCIGINHLGDWGTQFGKLIVAYRKWGDRALIEEKQIDGLVELYVKFHTEAEKDPSLEDLARAEFTKLEHHDPENTELWKWFIDISIKEYNRTYKQLGIEFDYYLGESFYSDKMPEQVQILKDKELLKIDDGASIVDLEAYGMPPCLILKKDGSTLYPTRDISAAVYRKKTYDFDKCIYVTSAGQSLHFAQWFKVMELMGYDWANELIHVPYGTVSINGAKLATRTGNVVLLKDLFAMAIEKVSDIITEKNPDLKDKEAVSEAVGVGAIVFHYLQNSRIKDINFVLEDALSFDGNTGPYAQYTYARTCSILEKSESGITLTECESYTKEETDVLKTLSLFPEKVSAALRDSEPSVITRYIFDVCASYNRFYHECKILNAEDENVKSFRVALTAAVRYVLGTALKLICMKTPEKI
ncbi:MAG: arginine--tRNA ligase [Ruminococcaceae bacterium]|nr:arginine--tRNA ligase [Oscillospiraceae bacterium]